jgi:ParB family chromosome partitioning protein
MADVEARLIFIDPDEIKQNPENPRLIFREGDMNTLLESIREVGIKVPLSVYVEDGHYVLIDGERRWRCAQKLNLPQVPALTQPRPGRLENILTMFNIHNVRKDWDLMPMALKLGDVREMLVQEGKPAKPKDLAGLTGVSEPTVRRALELLDLPAKYRNLLINEAEKPRDQQSVTADLFVEINKSKRAIDRYVPEVFGVVSRSQYVDSMVRKYRAGVVRNVVQYRDISKIARVQRTGGDPEDVIPVLVDLATVPDYTIDDAYAETVKASYERRDVITRATALGERLHGWSRRRRLPDDLREALENLRREIDRLLKARSWT